MKIKKRKIQIKLYGNLDKIIITCLPNLKRVVSQTNLMCLSKNCF